MFFIRSLLCGILALLSVVASPYSFSHSGSTSYFELEVESENDIHGDWYIGLQELELVLGLDLNQDGNLTWSEFQSQQSLLVSYASANIKASSSTENCDVKLGVPALSQLSNGVYSRIPLQLLCSKGEAISSMSYSAIFPDDLSHRAIVKIKNRNLSSDGESGDVSVLVMSPTQQQIFFDINALPGLPASLEMLKQGVIHILEGYDHLLFLLALLIPLTLEKGLWKRPRSRKVIFNLCKVISAFTLGHSITLVLATLFDIRPPIAFVESLIAASVIVAGINIVWPLFRESSWRVAIGFGLIHGFGFASVLSELNLSSSALASSLFTFNLGVEIGQLLVVVFVLPVMILTAMKQITIFFARSFAAIAIVSMGTVWLLERGF